MSDPPLSAPAVGSVLGERYELMRHIARGGMGDVYEADDRQLQRRVAVKVFRAAAATDRTRFDREVVMLAALNHPGLVQVFDAGEHGDDAFVVLELVDGPTLASRLASHGLFEPAEVASLGAAVADALAYVHERGVVHRDVTPSNVICGPDGRPRLADFGIARLIDTTRVTAASTALGAAAYMAPEQVQGHDVTPAADVYALGLVLLELLTGRKGFAGSPHEMMVARLVRTPDTETGVPGVWRPLLAGMTDRAPANRPSVAEVHERLLTILEPADATASAAAISAGEAPTQAFEPVGGGTMLMPVALVPDDGANAPLSTRPAGRNHGALVAAIAGLVLGLGVALALGGDGIGDRPPSTSTTVTTAPVVAAPASTTTTIAPPTTTVPPEGKKKDGKKDPPGDEGDD